MALSSTGLLAFLEKKGQFASVTWKRPMKTRKGVLAVIEKVCQASVQVGVNYDNKAAVIAKRESGELPAENAGIQNGLEWVVFPYILKKGDKRYLRVSTVKGGARKTVYLKDGQIVDAAEIKGLCLASEFPKEKREIDCFDITVDHIEEIH